MREVLAELTSIWRVGGTAGVATVVRIGRSAPRTAGAVMVVAPDGAVSGSVSGGRVEAEVYERATQVVRTGRPELERYRVSSCGGEIDVFVERYEQ